MTFDKHMNLVKIKSILNSITSKVNNLDVRSKKLKQIRTNALSAEIIYDEKISKIEFYSITITILTIIVPIAISFSLYVAKGSNYEQLWNFISYVSSASLLCLSILSLIFKLEQKKEAYIIGRRANIFIGNEALDLLDKKTDPSWFYKFVSEQDAKDKENISKITESLSQKAYRESLKKLNPSDTNIVCSVCRTSPHHYSKPRLLSKKTCRQCGNDMDTKKECK